MPDEFQSPEGATANLRFPEDCRRPFGALGLLWNRLPGADAPGYMPLPLAGQDLSVRALHLCISGCPCDPAYTTGPCRPHQLKKKAREDGPRPPSSRQKGTSIVKEHYSPPRERIPEVDEAVLLAA
jgi:hypothetical protein